MSCPPDDPENRTAMTFTLMVDDRPVEMTARLPAGEQRLADLLPILRKLDDALISISVDDVREGGRCVSCRVGCGACCRQVVPISEDEAVSLLEWMDRLPEEQRQVIDARFQRALAQLEENGMLEATRKANLNEDREAGLRFSLDYFHAGVACPFLINESCGIYPIRPLKCREYLVTSPAENCQKPSRESISMVRLPTHLSNVLFRVGVGDSECRAPWLPMVLLFEWAAQFRTRPRRQADSLELFQEFLSSFADTVSEQGESGFPIRPAD